MFILAVIASFALGIFASQQMVLAAGQEHGHPPSEMECTSQFCVNPSTGMVGMGTASPTQKLHVNGNILLDNDNIIRFKDTSGNQRNALRLSANNDLLITNPGAGAGDIIFNTGTSTKMIIKNNGNVGAGVVNPSARLQVQGDLRVDSNVREDSACVWSEQTRRDNDVFCPSGKYIAGIQCNSAWCQFYCCDL